MLKLTYPHYTLLLKQPESGMGYQVVEVTTKEDKKKRGVVYNAELLLFEEEPRQVMLASAYDSLLERAENSLFAVKDIRVIPKLAQQSAFAALRETGTVYGTKSKSAEEAPVAHTKAGEVFKRFSAYEKDHRVTPNGGLLPGSCATTEEDAKNVKTGKEAAARYALPNPKPAVYIFTVKPPKDTDVQRGTVQPANDQAGGGVEVIFTSGSPEKTVTGPDKIPEG
ncbi:MAG: hypothetical protein AAB676_18710 [Verrucomicrobiota bacterium]